MRIVQTASVLRSVASALWLATLVGCAPNEEYLFPEKKTAAEQYWFAVNYRSEQQKILTSSKKDLKEHNRPIIGAFSEVVAEYPNDGVYTPLALLDIADIYFDLNMYKKAFGFYNDVYERYASVDYFQARAILGRAICYERLKRHARARDLYKECADLYLDHPDEKVQKVAQSAKMLYERVIKR